jgi:WD40 repeat protein
VNALTAAFSPSGTTLATGDYNGHSYLWDTAPSNKSLSIYWAGFSPSGTTLAVADGNDSIYLWNIG